ncbi:MAG: LysM peptidoglycan-binding domain-containing protein [Oscillospiraceae bacterium]|jgi:spore germination protein|nr:LysM peptidoglycan-binding domain-containing protein [Oscillospiraceae bacterium]
MIIHVVSAGESVYSISRAYGVSPERIIINNDLRNPDRLVIGQTLVILYPAEVYVVKPGDSLYLISKKLGVPVRQLLQLNPQVSYRGIIYPGEELWIRYTDEKKGNIAINGYAYPHIDRVTLRRTLPFLTYLSIFAYGFSADGNLSSIADQELIDEAIEYGVAPLMVISAMDEYGVFSNELASLMLNNETVKWALIESIVRHAKSKGYAGVDVDFEFINASDMDAFALFVRELRSRCAEEGLVVFVALAPKTSADQPGQLYEGHDYRALGAAADRVLLMTYEWGYTYGPPLAVSPINGVRGVIEYAVTEIPPRKILMGMSNYGYDWPLPYVRGETRARGIGNVQAVDIAAENGAEIKYDEVSQAPFFNYYSSEGQPHIVWFEDARSINARTQLVPEFGLYGMGFWNIMRFFPQSWLVINSQFNIITV